MIVWKHNNKIINPTEINSIALDNLEKPLIKKIYSHVYFLMDAINISGIYELNVSNAYGSCMKQINLTLESGSSTYKHFLVHWIALNAYKKIINFYICFKFNKKRKRFWPLSKNH
jgi:hypothetical protein